MTVVRITVGATILSLVMFAGVAMAQYNPPVVAGLRGAPLAVPGMYLAGVFIASLVSKSSYGWERVCLFFVFPTMHLAWGLGFLLGPPLEASGQDD